MTRASLILLAAAATAALATAAAAQAPAPAAAPPPPLLYGPNITLEQAELVAAAGKAEAARRKLPMTLAIVDTAGELVYYQRATNAPGTAEGFAMKKAIAAAKQRVPTSANVARLKNNDPAIAYLPSFFPFPGGYPIVYQGKVIGAVGETGGADDDVAKAAASAPLP